MTTRYVGPGGSDANSGLTWALRKLTLNGVEDTPVVAGDLVYVGPGTYRELLTVDVSGTAGNPIEYRGDYLGQNTDGVGGVVRITGSDNDQTATRAQCITTAGVARNYRTFTGFLLDTGTGVLVLNSGGGTNWIIQKCVPMNGAAFPLISISGAGNNHTIQDCMFPFAQTNADSILFTHTAVVDNTGNLVQNCVFLGGANAVNHVRVGGTTVRNIVVTGRVQRGVMVTTALTVGQIVTVNNCIFAGCAAAAVSATVLGEIIEDYNDFYANGADRVNTNTGANSVTYPPLFDPRWFMQLVHAGAGPYSPLQLVSPFDLASFSALVNLAGTSPTTTDLRGTAVQGAQREWGALEYDSTLLKQGFNARSRHQIGM